MIQVAVHAQVHAIRHAALRVLQVVVVVLHRLDVLLVALLVVVHALGPVGELQLLQDAQIAILLALVLVAAIARQLVLENVKVLVPGYVQGNVALLAVVHVMKNA